MKNIVAFVGFKGCGKNSAANILKEQNYETFAFADALKDTCAAVFCWDRNMLEGDTLASRLWREEVDKWWANKLDIPDFTPRMALQNVGTDLFRQHFHPDIWLMNMERRISMVGANVAITDCRFGNEIQLAKGLGGKVIRIKRGPEPHWIEIARRANLENNKSLMKPYEIHESEWAWIGTPVDHEIDNSSTIDNLQKNVLSVLHRI